MCAISGILSRNGVQINPKILNSINESMYQRGPDAEGIWLSSDLRVGMAHRRLSIIDLSKNSNQPIVWKNNKYIIVFNGEIYNYLILKKELENKGVIFYTSSDTEVLVALYEDRGVKMVENLRGMFSFAIWDNEKKGIFLARDPYGVKPLYYTNEDGFFLWASQVKALASNIRVSQDPKGKVGFFVLGSVPEPDTIYKEIKSLPAGHWMWVDEKKIELHMYKSIAEQFRLASEAQPMSESDSLELAKFEIEESVKMHLISDAPIGAFLSAGLDSTALVTLMAQIMPDSSKLKTITLGIDEYINTRNDETKYAAKTAEKLGTSHTEKILRFEDLSKDIEKFIKSMDMPSIDGLNTYFVSQVAAQQGLKVVISGLGGDELLGGYSSFTEIPNIYNITKYPSKIPGLGTNFRIISGEVIKKFTSTKYSGMFEYGGSYGGIYMLRRGLYMPWELPELMDPEIAAQGWRELNLVNRLNSEINDISTATLKIAALESGWYMKNQLLRDADWAGMSSSIEIRVPLVDFELLRNLTPALSTLIKIGKKNVIKNCVQDILRPIIKKSKTGFSIPIKKWDQKVFNINSSERGLRGWAKNIFKYGGWKA